MSTFSIIIPVFNEARYIRQVIEAVDGVDVGPLSKEIIVVDDGSTDATPHILDDFEGLRVFRQENGGKPVALDHGLRHARGEAVLVLDDDDILLPGALHVLARCLDHRADPVHGRFLVIDNLLKHQFHLVTVPLHPGPGILQVDRQ